MVRETQRGYFFSFVGKQVQQLFSNLMHCGNNRKINNKPEKLFLFKQKARFFALTFLNIFPVDGKRKTYCKERQEKERCPESNLYLKVEKMNAKPGNMSTLSHLYSPENHRGSLPLAPQYTKKPIIALLGRFASLCICWSQVTATSYWLPRIYCFFLVYFYFYYWNQ